MIKAFYYLFIAGVMLSVAGCKKTGVIADNGCITRVTGLYSYNVSAADSAADAQFLQQHNISTVNLVFTAAKEIDTVTNSSGTNVYTYIEAIQKSNGLLIFNSQVSFNFKNGVFFILAGQQYNPTTNLSTTPKLSLPQVRKSFINAAANDNIYKHVSYADSCLVAQFGYYDIDDGGGTGLNIVPAWFVKPQHSPYPTAFIRDDNNTLIKFISVTLRF